MIRRTLLAAMIAVLLTGLLGASALASSPQMVKVVIGFDREVGPAEEAIIRGVGGDVKRSYRLVRVIAARVPATALQRLLQTPGVTGVEDDGEVFSADIEMDNSWGVDRIGADSVHTAGNKGAGVKVAIIDSGIDYTHPDLRANYAGGYDFVNDDADPMDDNGHGTHIAGTIAAMDDGFGVVGVAPEARLYALKVLNAAGSGYTSDVIAAVEWCIVNGIQVTNNSYGRSGYPGSVYRSVFDRAYAAGILHVASAGNSGTARGTGNTVGYPARLASVIAVAAVDKNDVRAYWSSTGPDVEVAAPGASIDSTLAGGGYGTMSGTSMASPHVAGLAALVFASGLTDANGNGRLNDEVRQRLIATADDLGAAGRDSWYGYGIVDGREAAPVPVAPVAGSIPAPLAVAADSVGGAQVTAGASVANESQAASALIADAAAGRRGSYPDPPTHH